MKDLSFLDALPKSIGVVALLAASAFPMRAMADPPPDSETSLAPVMIAPSPPPSPEPSPEGAPREASPEPAPREWSPEVLPHAPWVEAAPPEAPRPATPAVLPPPNLSRLLLQPHFGALFGHTSYALAVALTGVSGRSQLDFSLDTPTAGLDAAYLGGGGDSRPWSLRVSLTTNVTDPLGTLLDRDWLTVGIGPEVEFSHTDSRLSGRVVIGDLSARIALAGWRRQAVGVVLDAVVGYRHEAIFLDGWGVTGWQLAAASTHVPVFLADGVQVIHYQTQKLLPHVGLGLHGPLGRWMLLDADASVALAVSIDEDDHVFRFKRGDATSTGVGLLFHVAPRWIVYNGGPAHATVALGLDIQLRYLLATGRLHQHYYADDPSLPGDQRLVVIPDSDFTVTSLVGSVRSTVDIVF